MCKATGSELPEWAATTPPDIARDYALTMTGQPGQDLDVTRAEFIKLKRHLAEMRGYKPEWEDQRGPAFLIGPQGYAPRALSDNDFKRVSEYLSIRQSSNDEACGAIDWLIHQATDTPGMTDEGVLEQSLFHYANGHTYGVLVEIFGMPRIDDLSKEEVPLLQYALVALRAGGWFAEWLGLTLTRIALYSEDPTRRYPTPLQIAESLREDILQHEDRVDTAREIIRMRPDILKLSAMPPMKASATPEPPAAPEPIQPAAKPAAKAQRTRKRKKASSA